MNETVYQLNIEVEVVPPDRIAAHEQRLDYSVLTTDVTDPAQLSTRDVLTPILSTSSSFEPDDVSFVVVALPHAASTVPSSKTSASKKAGFFIGKCPDSMELPSPELLFWQVSPRLIYKNVNEPISISIEKLITIQAHTSISLHTNSNLSQRDNRQTQTAVNPLPHSHSCLPPRTKLILSFPAKKEPLSPPGGET
ncbi:MAG: hypothetical protein J7639_27175 [Paenibacillaceae bacterium]|nr:hypothetical protein [Paenibacillaceae bacterium]